jgi:hypothetical protein
MCTRPRDMGGLAIATTSACPPVLLQRHRHKPTYPIHSLRPLLRQRHSHLSHTAAHEEVIGCHPNPPIRGMQCRGKPSASAKLANPSSTLVVGISRSRMEKHWNYNESTLQTKQEKYNTNKRSLFLKSIINHRFKLSSTKEQFLSQ